LSSQDFHRSEFLRATAATAVAHFSHRNSVYPSVYLCVCLSVCHTGGSGLHSHRHEYESGTVRISVVYFNGVARSFIIQVEC